MKGSKGGAKGNGARCTKGKSCGATCIDPRERCVLELGPLVSPAMGKASSMLEQRKGSAAPPIKKLAAPPAPESSGVEKIQKIADDQKLERLKAQAEEYKKRWGETIGKGSKENTERASATWKMVQKEYDDFKKEYDDKYNRPVAKSPKELMAQESKRVRDLIEERIKSGQTYSKEVNAQIQADGEKKYAPFKKLSNDELASLELY